MDKLTLVIPAYNEAEGVFQTAAKLRPVLDSLRRQYEVEVVFVNDGSKDNTYALLQDEFARDKGVKVVTHDRNRGLGAAIRTGFSHATGDVIVTTDFDGTYAFDTIPALLAQFNQDDVDITTASPYHPKGKVENVPGYRLLFSFGASLLYRLLVKWNIYCWTALFRAYKRRVVETITFESDDFLAGTEVLVKALWAGYTVSEFPTTLSSRTFGQSSLKIARVTRKHLGFQARILWATLTGKRKTHLNAATQGNA
jgi:dolichol-phosphate mannosyltransferase